MGNDAGHDHSDLISKLNGILPKIAEKDASLWGPTSEAPNRLGWVDLPVTSRQLLPELDALSAWTRSNKLDQFVLCGMGGSSLATELIAKTNNKNITILDSTHPEQIIKSIPKDLVKSLVIIASKSGTTIETLSHFKFFEKLFLDSNLEPKNHIVLITDQGTSLDSSGRKSGYRVFNADSKVGGRFSALTAFGLLPASLTGTDVSILLDDAEKMSKLLVEPNSVAVQIAVDIFTRSKQFVYFVEQQSTTPGLANWIEQLIAESTGKGGVGRLPIVVNELNQTNQELSIGFKDGQYDLVVKGSLGEHLILWQWVTVLLCFLLEVDPFNQPNVTEAKDQTSKILTDLGAGNFVHEQPRISNKKFDLFSNLEISTVSDFLNLPCAYFSIMAFLPSAFEQKLIEVQNHLISKLNKPVTFGLGPRYLHSTGQIHKGGQSNGGFIQITQEIKTELAIPGEQYTFGQLISAQALGDANSLTARGVALLRIHIKNKNCDLLEIFN